MARNRQVDVLRGILILLIVVFHYTFRFSALYKIPTINFATLAEWGTIGVAGFFVISGYFLKPKETRDFKVFRYLRKRLTRLYPMYFLAVIVIFVMVTIFGLAGREVSFRDFLLNIPLVNGFIGVPYVDGAHWYITYLLIFTIIMAVIVKIKVPMKYWLVIWLIIKDIMFFMLPQAKILALPYKLIGGDYVEYVVIGLALAEILRFKVVQKSEQGLLLALIVIALAQKGFMAGPIVGIGVATFVGIFILAIQEKLSFLNKTRLLGVIGDSSYVLYLFHQNIGYIILLGACATWGDSLAVLYVGLTIILMTSGSFVIHKFIEKPVQKILIKKEKNKCII